MLLLVASETGHVYTFATPKLQPLITKPEGKNLIQACLNAPDGSDYHGAYDHDEEVDDRQAQGGAQGMPGIPPQTYAAAMAGLTGYQYSAGGAGSAASMAQAYMNPAHYPAYAAAAQYNNMAAAAAYWPQQQQMMQHQQQQQQQAQSGTSAGASPLPEAGEEDKNH